MSKLIFIVTFLFLLSYSTNMVFAANNTKEFVCGDKQKSFSELYVKYSGVNTGFLDTYVRINDRLALIIDSLEKNGFDTSLLKANTITLQDKFSRLFIDMQTFLNNLKDIRDNVCTFSSTAEYNLKFEELKKSIVPVKNDIFDTRDFYNSKYLIDLRNATVKK